jgi:hypothetical protein
LINASDRSTCVNVADMVRTVSRVLLACVFVCLVFVPVNAAVGAPVGEIVLAQPGTAPPGPDIPPAQTTEDAAQSKDKLVIGVTALVLLAIVVFGHRLRSKRKKDSGGS